LNKKEKRKHNVNNKEKLDLKNIIVSDPKKENIYELLFTFFHLSSFLFV